ncbi:MFS transporter [Streptomyces flavidovirens]
MTPAPVPVARPYLALAVLCSALFLIGLDATVMNVALPTLQADLQPSTQGLLWVADGYALALACGVLAAGAWSDTHGRRRALTFGLALCGAASVGGALATSTAQVVGARLSMGAGAALLMPSTLSLIAVVFPDPAMRRRAIAVWTLVAGLGAIAGPVVGGVLIEHFSWRAGFWINVPVCLLVLAGTWRWLPESRHPRPGPTDRTGTVTATAGLLALVWAITEAPIRGWTNPTVAAGFFTAAGVLAFLVVWERRHPSPMLPPALFSDRRLTAAASALAWMFFALFGSLLMLTLYLQTILGYSPAQTGLRLLPLAAAAGAGAGLSLLIAPRWGDKLAVTGGMLLMTSGFLFLAFAQPASGYAPVLGFQLVAGCGAALAAAPATEAIMGAVPGERTGTGAAINDLVREVGGALGIATLGSLLTAHHRATQLKTTHGSSEHLAPETGPVADAAALTAGLHTASWAAIAATLFAALLAARWLPNRAPASEPDRPLISQPQETL